MILQRERQFLRQNFVFYLIGILVVLGIKYYYSQAGCDSLLWILAPTTHWVELLSGIPFTYVSGTGYVNHSLRLWIAPSCSGVQFMIITVATLVFSFVHKIAASQESPLPKTTLSVIRGLGWIAVSIVFSWLFTVFINGLRIIVAIYLPLYLDRAGLMTGLLTPDRLHTMIGVVVYVIALLTLYRFVGYFVHRKSCQPDRTQNTDDSPKICREQFLQVFIRKCVPPIFWYFFMTLGLPFLNRAYLKGSAKFTEYAVLITCCCAVILLPYCLVLLLHSRRRIKDSVTNTHPTH